MPEAHTVRELREGIREAEAAIERLHMAPAVALTWEAGWYLKKARTALRQAERRAAKHDDPRLPELKPLSAQTRKPRPSTKPRRTRLRCPVCFTETLACLTDSNYYGRAESLDCPRRRCDGVREPVARRAKR